MKTLFVDTNLFLQCKSLEDLPWEEVANGHDLLLIIPEAVIREIDRLKNDGNSRRARRARNANTLIQELLNAEDQKKCLKESNPRVDILIPIKAIKIDDNIDSLDPAVTDHRIVLEALGFKAIDQTAQITILSGDAIIRLKAKQHGVACVQIPSTWLSDPEPDEKDKKLARLEKELADLKKTDPVIEISFKNQEGSPIDFLSASIITYDQLTEEQIEQLINLVQEQHPLVTDFSDTSTTLGTKLNRDALGYERYYPPSEEQIAKYRREYREWLGSVKQFYASFSDRMKWQKRFLSVEFVISNLGGRPAENCLIELYSVGKIRMKPPPDSGNDHFVANLPKMPTPPTAPIGRWEMRKLSVAWGIEQMDQNKLRAEMVLAAARHDQLINPIRNYMLETRDRNTFYWNKDQSGYADYLSLECNEFMHKVEPEERRLNLHFPIKEDIESGALKVRVRAKNLKSPKETTLPIKLSYRKEDIWEYARKSVTGEGSGGQIPP